MRVANLFSQYRKSINPPYRKKDFVVILGTIVILLTIPITTFYVNQVREPISHANPTIKKLDCFPDENKVSTSSNVENFDNQSKHIAVVPPASYPGAIITESSIEEQTARAELITVGKIKKINSRKEVETIITDVNFEVENTLKGKAKKKELTVTIPGGQVGDFCLFVGGVPNFLTNERVLLFLKDEDNPKLVQLWQSKYTIAKDELIQPDAKTPRMSIKEAEERIGKILGHEASISANLQEEVVSSSFTTYCTTWENSSMPVPYEVNPNNPGNGGSEGNDFLRLTYNSLHNWQELSDSYGAFTVSGNTENTGLNHFDGNNTVAWRDLTSLGYGLLGINYCAVQVYYRFDSDTLINNNSFVWDSDDSDGITYGQYSLQSVMEHELGHGLGLGHTNELCSSSTSPLMCPSIHHGIRKIIRPDDQAGAAFLYPLSGSPPTSPSNLTVTPGINSNNLSWLASPGSVIAYDIQRSGNACSDPFRSIQTVSDTITTYQDNNLGDGIVPEDNCYRIKALGVGGDSAYLGQGPADTVLPTVSINNPSNGATVSGTVNITATASDNVGVTKVEFYVDNILKSTDTSSPYSYSWNTTTFSNSNHTLLTKAYDAAGNVGTSSTVTVTVNNPTNKPGDLNGDGSVNIFDASIMSSKWGTNDPEADLNGNGVVDIFDVSIMVSNWDG